MKSLNIFLNEGLLDAADPNFKLNPFAGYPLISPLEKSLIKPEVDDTPKGQVVTYKITDIFGNVLQRIHQFNEFQKEFAAKRQKILTNTWCCNEDNFQKIVRCRDFRKGEMAYDVDVMQFSGGIVDYLSFIHLDEMQLFKSRVGYAYYYAVKWYPIENKELQKYFDNLWKEKYEKFI